MKNITRMMCLSAMFAAMIFVSTMIIQIPTPTNGYVNLGDAFILVGSWLLPCGYASAAAAIGSVFSDIVAGYYHYAAATFIIKGLMAFASAFIYKHIHKAIFGRFSGAMVVSCLISAIAAEFIMVAGYTVYELFLYGAGALVGVVANIEQALVGILLSIAVMSVISRIKSKL